MKRWGVGTQKHARAAWCLTKASVTIDGGENWGKKKKILAQIFATAITFAFMNTITIYKTSNSSRPLEWSRNLSIS